VQAFVRNREEARMIVLPGVEFAEGDFARLETFVPGIERLFLLIPSSSNVETQQRNFVDAATRSGVRLIVKLSQFGADKDSPGRFQRYHGAVETYTKQFGIAYTFLRPNLFMQGLLSFRPPITAEGRFYATAGDGKVSIVDVRDIAAVAARALAEAGHEGKAARSPGRKQ
jgi:uncharacterized protein YbjT (DUF2867 family)